jgi:hypothetical protein
MNENLLPTVKKFLRGHTVDSQLGTSVNPRKIE